MHLLKDSWPGAAGDEIWDLNRRQTAVGQLQYLQCSGKIREELDQLIFASAEHAQMELDER